MNKRITFSLYLLIWINSISLFGQYNGNCDFYFPCSVGAEVRWLTFKGNTADPSFEVENVKILSVNNQAIQFERRFNVIDFQNGSDVSFSHQGQVVCNDISCAFGPDYFLPRPSPTLSTFFSPPIISYSGQSCELPNHPSIGPLSDCSTMKISVESAVSSSSSNAFLAGNAGFEFAVNYNQRKVLSLNSVLEINNQSISCVVIQERRQSSGGTQETVFEVSWIAKGVGKIRSVFYKDDPGSNWNNPSGSIGYRQAVVF